MMKGSYDQRSRSLVSQEHVAERGVLNSVSESLRRVRQERGLTLEELAQRSGVSIGMLSQLERGVGNPSLRTLVKIAKGLGVPMGYFLSGIDHSSAVVRKHERRRLVLPAAVLGLPDSDLVYQLLSPDLSGSLEMLWIEYGVGVSTEESPFTHDGEECGVILQGTLEVHVADEVWTLEAGDSVYFHSAIPHWFRNPGSEPAVMVWAITPPSF